MLITLLTWIYQLFLILPIGLIFITIRYRQENAQKITLAYLPLAFLLGLAAVTALSSLASLVINISWQAHGFVLLLAIIFWVILIRQKQLPRINFSLRSQSKTKQATLVILLLAVGTVLVLATTSPENPDTGIYHAQAIRWIETYKAVPGLANLHQRFGYNSSWLVANALFSLSFLKIQSFHLLPSTLFVVMVAYFFSGIFSIAGGSRKFSELGKAAFFVAAFLLLPQEISSPGTDLPVTLMTWFVCCEWIRLVEEPMTADVKNGFWLSVITLLCATIKLSSVPLLIFVIWFLVKELKRQRWRSILTIVAAAVIIVGPFISRNIVISGHLFYPGLKSDPIHVDWAVPQESVQKEKAVIHAFAVLPNKGLNEFREMAWHEQYKKWFFNQIPRHQAMLVFLAAAVLISILALTFRRGRTWLKSYAGYGFIFIMLFAGVAFWLVSAPAFRFGYGFIIGLIVMSGIPLILIFERVLKNYPFVLTSLVSLAAVVILAGALVNYAHPKTISSRILLPLDYPVLRTEKCEFGNFSIKCQVEYDSCWYSSFPCAIQGDTRVFLRGDDFSDGFMVKP